MVRLRTWHDGERVGRRGAAGGGDVRAGRVDGVGAGGHVLAVLVLDHLLRETKSGLRRVLILRLRIREDISCWCMSFMFMWIWLVLSVARTRKI